MLKTLALMTSFFLRWFWKMLPCFRSVQTSSPTPATISPSSWNLASSCSRRARPTSTTLLLSRWNRRGSSASSLNAEATVGPGHVAHCLIQSSEASLRNISVLRSRGAEHEDVDRNESWHRAGSDLLHESQDRHEVQQWLHEGPHPVSLQEHPPPPHWKHI